MEVIFCHAIEARRNFPGRKNEKKREEDMAYCMFGIFDVQMPLIYSEARNKAMARLQREIREAGRSEESAADNMSPRRFRTPTNTRGTGPSSMRNTMPLEA
jgi:hypothetical protein